MNLIELDALLRKNYLTKSEIDNLYLTHLKELPESKFFDFEKFNECDLNAKINYILYYYSNDPEILEKKVKQHKKLKDQLPQSKSSKKNNSQQITGNSNISIQDANNSNININISK